MIRCGIRVLSLLLFCAQTVSNAQAPNIGESPAGEAFDATLPGVDPSAGLLRFNGQTWNVSNDALFKARLEKFLSTPEEKSEQEQAHRKILNEIIVLLDPNNLKTQTLSEAYRLLARASAYPGDSRLCDTLSGAIYSIWQSKRSQSRIREADRILGEEIERAKRNMAATAYSDQNAGSGRRPSDVPPALASSSIIQAGRAETIVENGIRIKANEAKGELSELTAKVQFQGLLVQLFVQRRFHHLVIGTRFYRAIFDDGNSRLNLPDSSQNPFAKVSSAPPTISTLESLANEAMREVQTNVQAFHRLYELGELRAASERLREALLIGEFMPEVRTLPFERRRKVLSFLQNSERLQSSLELRDYEGAERLLDGPNGLRQTATDFDAIKVRALIDGARNASSLLIAKARNAANSGDKDGFEAALKEAAAIWPNNPALQEAASKAFTRGDILAQTQLEMEQLIAQKNLRRIAEESGRFLAASQSSSEQKQLQLKGILEDFKKIEAVLMAAREMDNRGNAAGAWEAVSKVSGQFPDDVPLSQAHALYTSKAAEYVRLIQTAQDHERRGQNATSLAWYLKAQHLYPKSELAAESIRRVQNTLLPSPSR
jgi:hypothetical protein